MKQYGRSCRNHTDGDKERNLLEERGWGEVLGKQNKKCLWHLPLFFMPTPLSYQFHSLNKHVFTRLLSVCYILYTVLDFRDEKITMRPLSIQKHSEIQRNIKYTWVRTSRNLPYNWGEKAVYLENNQVSSCVLWMMKLKEGKWGQWGLEHSGETTWRGWYFGRVFKGWGSFCLWPHVFQVQDFHNITLSEALCSWLSASGGLLECSRQPVALFLSQRQDYHPQLFW